jgi:sigma-B regulation protein RsbU (phosphoserine phosphatase)
MKINSFRADQNRLSRVVMASRYNHGREIETVFASLNNLSVGIIITNEDGKFIFFNPVANRILGIGSKNIKPDKWTSVYGLYYPDKLTPFPPQKFPLILALNGEKIHDERIFIKNSENPDGIHISLDANPVRNAHGSIIGGSIIIRDISETIESELSLNESRERLNTQLKGFPQPTYVWKNIGDDFILIDYNHAAKEFKHGNIEKHLGIKLSQMYSDSPEIRADFKACFEKKSVLSRETTYAYKNNHIQRNGIFNYVYLPPDSIMMHTEDITERKNNEQELRKLSSAVEQTADSVILTDKNGIIEYVNPAFEKTTGFTSEEVIGKTPAILKSGHHDINFYKTLWEVILGGDPYTGTILNKKKDGLLYWCEQSITPMKNENGLITNFVSVIRDISELKKKQEQDFYLRIATEVQQRLSKTKFSVPGFDIAGATHSALETSGDYFDFLHTADGHILLVVGDVSGHGIGAALIMAETRAFLRAFAKKDSDPANILRMLNEELLSDLDEYNYVTLFLARINPTQNFLDYASAGHIPAYIVNSKGKVIHVLKSTGIPLGYLSEEKYSRSKTIALKSGYILALPTDGISEATANDESEFGYDRMIEIINKHRTETAKQIVDRLNQAVCSFTTKQHQEDDITAVICKVN